MKRILTYLIVLCLSLPVAAHAGRVRNGTVTLANCKNSMVNGTAFLDIGVDLSVYASSDAAGTHKYWIKLTDSSGNVAWGYIGASGGGETLGGELLTNGDFTNWTADDPDDWSYTGDTGNYSVAENPAGECQIVTDGTYCQIEQSSAPVLGSLLKMSIECTAWSANAVKVFIRESTTNVFTSEPIDSVDTYTGYVACAVTPQVFRIARSGASDVTIDNASYKPITDCSTDGVHIFSTKTGSTQNWTSIDGSFDYNDSSGYTWEIYASTPATWWK